MTATVAPLLRLVAALVFTGLVLAALAGLLVGPLAVQGVAYSFLLCLLPGVLVFVRSALGGSRTQPVFLLLISMVLRMAVVLVGAVVICVSHSEMRGGTFLFWLVPMYCVALAVEATDAARAQSGRGQLGHPASEAGTVSLGSSLRKGLS